MSKTKNQPSLPRAFKDWITVAEAGKILEVSRQGMWWLVNHHKIKIEKVGPIGIIKRKDFNKLVKYRKEREAATRAGKRE